MGFFADQGLGFPRLGMVLMKNTRWDKGTSKVVLWEIAKHGKHASWVNKWGDKTSWRKKKIHALKACVYREWLGEKRPMGNFGLN